MHHGCCGEQSASEKPRAAVWLSRRRLWPAALEEVKLRLFYLSPATLPFPVARRIHKICNY